MNELSKENKPDYGDWVVYIEIAHHGGHMHSSLVQWSKDLETRLFEEEVFAHWVSAEDVAIDMMQARIISKMDEANELSKAADIAWTHINEIEKDIERLVGASNESSSV